MKLLLSFAVLCSFATAFSQTSISVSKIQRISQDTLIAVEANPEAGFGHDYLLFLPKGVAKNKKNCLLVEPNNTGFTTDSIEIHREGAIFVATERSLGHIAAKELKLPFLVPVFPRPKNQNLVYTHALDRDAMLSTREGIKRLDLQLLAMIEDAQTRLMELGIPVEEKVLMTGFSASGSFVNRFTFLHPEAVKAVVAGGLNGILMLPRREMAGHPLNYPLGVNDLQEITGKEFNLTEYKKVPQFLFMGALDDNDAVPYDDAYSDEERAVIYATVGKQMQPQRWEKCQQIYMQDEVNAKFRTYNEVGHRSTAGINFEVIQFLMNHISRE